MSNKILFRLKIRGTFERAGFIANISGDIFTLTKFSDDTLMLKQGRTTINDRFSGSKKLTNLILNTLNQ